MLIWATSFYLIGIIQALQYLTIFLWKLTRTVSYFEHKPPLQNIVAYSNFTDLNLWTVGVNLEKRPSYDLSHQIS